jgi:hypothetical protein
MNFLDVTGKPREIEIELEKTKKPVYDWCYENNINTGKEILNVEEQEFKYEAWRTNSSLSNHMETLFYSNIMNINYHLRDDIQYAYLFHSVRKAKRYGKKKTEQDKLSEKRLKDEQDKILLIQDFYKYNQTKAKEALSVLSEQHLEIIRKRLEKGGTK